MSIHATQTADFVAKYAPKKFSDIVINTQQNEAVLQQYVADKPRQPLILYGGNGTGKSTIANLLPYAMASDADSGDILWLQPFMQSDAAKLHQQIANFAPMATQNSANLRFIIFDELDLFPTAFVKTVKACIDTFSAWCLFIATTNDIHALDKGHLSRSNVLHIDSAPLAQWKPRVQKIMAAENAPLPSDAALANLLSVSKGDNRQFLSLLQQVANRTRPLPSEPQKPAAIISYPKPNQP